MCDLRPLFDLRRCGVWVLSAVAASAQAPAWHIEVVPGAAQAAVVVVIDRGFDDDAPEECGLARVLAECRLAAARAVVPSGRDTGVVAFGDAMIVHAVLPAGEVGVFADALLGAADGLHDDVLARILASVALTADDGAWLFPGQALESRLRQSMFAGQRAARGAAGQAAALHVLPLARVRAALREPFAATGTVYGTAVDVAGLPRLPSPPRAIRPRCIAADPPAAMSVATHPRVDGPFVAAAVAAPAEAGWPVFAVAVEVARQRAARRLRLRGGEAMARAPLLAWSWRGDEPLAVFCRRGFDGDPCEPARAELEALFTHLRANPPTTDELTVAKLALVAELSPAPSAVPTAASLLTRAIGATLARRRGAVEADLASVDSATVHAVLVACLRPERLHWAAFVPSAVPPDGPRRTR